MVAVIDSRDITNLLELRSATLRRGGHASVAWRQSSWQGKSSHLVLVLASDDRNIRWIGRAQGRKAVTDRDRRIAITEVRRIDDLPLEQLRQKLPEASRSQLGLGVLPDDVGRATVEALIVLYPMLAEVIRNLDRQLAYDLDTDGREIILNEQRDGIGLLLEISGAGRELLRGTQAPTPDQPSFLAGMGGRAVSEETIIDHDLGRFPGMVAGLSAHADWRVFQAGRRQKMFVMNANMEPLETTLGVDVIYYNESRRSFVLVQYKRLVREPSGSSASAWYRPDGNIGIELDRMREVDHLFGAATDGDFRLHGQACWLKLCDSEAHVADPMDLIKGMYLAREYFEELLASSHGPRGGVRLGYENVPRHLNNTTFAQLVKDGWVGTRGTGTSELGDVVRRVLQSRRAIVLGAQV